MMTPFSPWLCSLPFDLPPLAARLEGAQCVQNTSEVMTICHRSQHLRPPYATSLCGSNSCLVRQASEICYDIRHIVKNPWSNINLSYWSVDEAKANTNGELEKHFEGNLSSICIILPEVGIWMEFWSTRQRQDCNIWIVEHWKQHISMSLLKKTCFKTSLWIVLNNHREHQYNISQNTCSLLACCWQVTQS